MRLPRGIGDERDWRQGGFKWCSTCEQCSVRKWTVRHQNEKILGSSKLGEGGGLSPPPLPRACLRGRDPPPSPSLGEPKTEPSRPPEWTFLPYYFALIR